MRTTRHEPAWPCLLHNMSVPSTSRLTVARARLDGTRFAVDLEQAFGHKAETIRDRLARGGWRAAFRLLEPWSTARRQTRKSRTPQNGRSRAPHDGKSRTAQDGRTPTPHDGKSRTPRACRSRTAHDLERILQQALEDAGVPARLGVFLDEGRGPEGATPLAPAAALAVLARRSGPLYLPSRRLEPSLVDPRKPFVLFFPEETP